MNPSERTAVDGKNMAHPGVAESGCPQEAPSPVRVQLKRTKGWRMPPNTVKVDRSSPWGNDFTLADYGDAETCVDLFHHDLDKFQVFHPDKYEAWIAPLRGKNLACWCSLKLGTFCHADVLLELAAESDDGAERVQLGDFGTANSSQTSHPEGSD